MARLGSLSIALFLVTLLAQTVEAAPAEPTDLTPTFQAAGVAIDRLQVFEIGGVVIIRGRTYDKADAEEASRLAKQLGYTRVANLVQILQQPDDDAIERVAQLELTMHPALDGTRLRVRSQRGVVSVAGRVTHELQKDVAVALLRSIEGVREVRASLTRP